MFAAEECLELFQASKEIMKSRNKELRELFQRGFAIHHAGMLRSDRLLVEKVFSQGLVKVLSSCKEPYIHILGSRMHCHTCLGSQPTCTHCNYSRNITL